MIRQPPSTTRTYTLLPCTTLVRPQVQRRAAFRITRVGEDRVDEVALRAVDRLALQVLQRVDHAPALAGLAAGPLDVDGVAATNGGGARHEADRITLDVFAQHHVDHAGHRIGAVNGRREIGRAHV